MKFEWYLAIAVALTFSLPFILYSTGHQPIEKTYCFGGRPCFNPYIRMLNSLVGILVLVGVISVIGTWFKWYLLIPIALTLSLLFIGFVPVIHPDYAPYQYTSISYTYGGWGAVFDTGRGINMYSIACAVCLSTCSPYGGIFSGPPCSPYGEIFWPLVAVFLADVLAIAFYCGLQPEVPAGNSNKS